MSILTVFYLISLFNNLAIFLSIITVVSIISSIGFGIWYITNDGTDSYGRLLGQGHINQKIKILKLSIYISLSSCFINCFIPNQLTMYSMVGVKYLSDTKLPEKVINLVNLKLDEYINSQLLKSKEYK